MSTSSYSNISLSFPNGTKHNTYCELADSLHDDGNRWKLTGLEGDGRYIDGILDEVIELFDGKRLDEVPGLTLELLYECFDDDPWYCTVTIDDGKVKCQEAVMSWHECTLDATGVDIGQPMVRAAKRAWTQLGKAQFDDDGNLLYNFGIGDIGYWCKGTNREQIWHDIERNTHVSVAWLMGQAKNPDGTND